MTWLHTLLAIVRGKVGNLAAAEVEERTCSVCNKRLEPLPNTDVYVCPSCDGLVGLVQTEGKEE